MVGGAFACVESMAGALGGVGFAPEGSIAGTLGGVGLATEGALFTDGTGGAGGLIFGIGGTAPPVCDACEDVERLGKPFDLALRLFASRRDFRSGFIPRQPCSFEWSLTNPGRFGIS